MPTSSVSRRNVRVRTLLGLALEGTLRRGPYLRGFGRVFHSLLLARIKVKGLWQLAERQPLGLVRDGRNPLTAGCTKAGQGSVDNKHVIETSSPTLSEKQLTCSAPSGKQPQILDCLDGSEDAKGQDWVRITGSCPV
jgi:hypothetical protein